MALYLVMEGNLCSTKNTGEKELVLSYILIIRKIVQPHSELSSYIILQVLEGQKIRVNKA